MSISTHIKEGNVYCHRTVAQNMGLSNQMRSCVLEPQILVYELIIPWFLKYCGHIWRTLQSILFCIWLPYNCGTWWKKPQISDNILYRIGIIVLNTLCCGVLWFGWWRRWVELHVRCSSGVCCHRDIHINVRFTYRCPCHRSIIQTLLIYFGFTGPSHNDTSACTSEDIHFIFLWQNSVFLALTWYIMLWG